MLGMLAACVLYALVVVLYVHALIDCVRTPDARIRLLPKILWLLAMFAAPILGALAWTYLGKRPDHDAGEAISGIMSSDSTPSVPVTEPTG